jgi:hypothetical protein
MKSDRDITIINKIITLLQNFNIVNNDFKFHNVYKGWHTISESQMLPVCYVFYNGNELDLNAKRKAGGIGLSKLNVMIVSYITVRNKQQWSELNDKILQVKNQIESLFVNSKSHIENNDALDVGFYNECTSINTSPFIDWDKNICELYQEIIIDFWDN